MFAFAPVTAFAAANFPRRLHEVDAECSTLSKIRRGVRHMNTIAHESIRDRVKMKSTSSPGAFALPEDEFQLFYKVSDYDCNRISESPLLRDHIGLLTYSLSDFEGDGYEVKLTREKLETISKINVDRKHVSLLNVGIASSHCRNLGWIKVIDAFRSGGAQSISYQFQHRYAELDRRD